MLVVVIGWENVAKSDHVTYSFVVLTEIFSFTGLSNEKISLLPVGAVDDMVYMIPLSF